MFAVWCVAEFAKVLADQQIVWDLFANVPKVSGAIELDAALLRRITELRARLLGPLVWRWGQRQEWMDDVDDARYAPHGPLER